MFVGKVDAIAEVVISTTSFVHNNDLNMSKRMYAIFRAKERRRRAQTRIIPPQKATTKCFGNSPNFSLRCRADNFLFNESKIYKFISSISWSTFYILLVVL